MRQSSPVKKISILGRSLSGRTEFLRALGKHLGEEVRKDHTANMLTLSTTVQCGSGSTDLRFGRVDLSGSLYSSSFREAVEIDPKARHRAQFLLDSHAKIFVLDGQRQLIESNLEAIRLWEELCLEIGTLWDPGQVLFVVNKVDLPNAVDKSYWAETLDIRDGPLLAVSSVTGYGIAAGLSILSEFLKRGGT